MLIFFFQQIIIFSILRYHSIVHVDFRKKIWITEYFSYYDISVGVIATQKSFNNGKRNQTKQNKIWISVCHDISAGTNYKSYQEQILMSKL